MNFCSTSVGTFVINVDSASGQRFLSIYLLLLLLRNAADFSVHLRDAKADISGNFQTWSEGGLFILLGFA